jgi:SnoaL-like domain
MHAIHNLTIEVHGDEAFSEAYFVAYIGRADGGAEYVDAFCGRYIDRWERRGGEWGVVHRDVAREWARGNAFGTEQFPVPPSEEGTFIQPIRSREDPSYQGLTER